MRVAVLLALLTACKEPAPPPALPPAPPAAREAAPAATGESPAARGESPAAGARAACFDAWLAARHLNQFGDPPGTVYAGGTPLFDEAASTPRDRLRLLLAKHPGLEQACPER